MSDLKLQDLKDIFTAMELKIMVQFRWKLKCKCYQELRMHKIEKVWQTL